MDSKNISCLSQDVNHLNENLRVTLSTCNDRGHQTVISSRSTALLPKNLHDPQEIDLHIKTNFAVEINKRIKIYLLLNFSFSIAVLVICCIFVIELKNELKHVKHNVSTLEQDISKLITKYNYFELNESDVSTKVPFKSKEQNTNVNISVLTSESSVIDQVKYSGRFIHKGFNVGNSEEQVIPIIQLRGRKPEYEVNNGGKIGPWVFDNTVMNIGVSLNFSLEDNNSTVQILNDGLYNLYAQLFYETNNGKNSYSIMLKSKDNTSAREVVSCSTDGNVSFQSPIDMSCFTSIMHYLKYGDKIYIQQREQGRKIIMRKGYSFFGIMRINS